MYAALESYAYNNILVIKYFCITTNFTRIYVCTHSDLSNDQSYYIHINLNVRITIAQFNYKWRKKEIIIYSKYVEVI